MGRRRSTTNMLSPYHTTNGTTPGTSSSTSLMIHSNDNNDNNNNNSNTKHPIVPASSSSSSLPIAPASHQLHHHHHHVHTIVAPPPSPSSSRRRRCPIAASCHWCCPCRHRHSSSSSLSTAAATPSGVSSSSSSIFHCPLRFGSPPSPPLPPAPLHQHQHQVPSTSLVVPLSPSVKSVSEHSIQSIALRKWARRFALGSYIVSIILVISTLILSHVNMAAVRTNRGAVMRHMEISQATNQLYTSLLDAETSQRGYMLVNKTELLEPYYTGRAEVKAQLNYLAGHVGIGGQRLMLNLAPAIDQKLREMEGTQVAWHHEGAKRVMERILDGYRWMTLIKESLNKMRDEQNAVLNTSWSTTTASYDRLQGTTFGSVAGVGVAVLMGCLVFFTSDKKAQQATEQDLSKLVTAAQSAARVKTTFLAAMSHEIRTPMNGVVAIAEELNHTDLNPDQRSMLDIIRSSADAMMRLINDILLFSKIEASQFTLLPELFELRPFLQPLVESSGMRAQGKGLQFILSVDNDTPAFMYTDAGRLRQVLVNLIDNALKFTLTGEIRLHVGVGEPVHMIDRPSGKGKGKGVKSPSAPPRRATYPIPAAVLMDREMEILFEVRDTGIGISEGAQSKLFQPFSQADPTTARDYGGTGLGLAVSAELVKLMGGNISVQSQVGIGTCFSFTIKSPGVDSALVGVDFECERDNTDILYRNNSNGNGMSPSNSPTTPSSQHQYVTGATLATKDRTSSIGSSDQRGRAFTNPDTRLLLPPYHIHGSGGAAGYSGVDDEAKRSGTTTLRNVGGSDSTTASPLALHAATTTMTPIGGSNNGGTTMSGLPPHHPSSSSSRSIPSSELKSGSGSSGEDMEMMTLSTPYSPPQPLQQPSIRGRFGGRNSIANNINNNGSAGSDNPIDPASIFAPSPRSRVDILTDPPQAAATGSSHNRRLYDTDCDGSSGSDGDGGDTTNAGDHGATRININESPLPSSPISRGNDADYSSSSPALTSSSASSELVGTYARPSSRVPPSLMTKRALSPSSAHSSMTTSVAPSVNALSSGGSSSGASSGSGMSPRGRNELAAAAMVAAANNTAAIAAAARGEMVPTTRNIPSPRSHSLLAMDSSGSPSPIASPCGSASSSPINIGSGLPATGSMMRTLASTASAFGSGNRGSVGSSSSSTPSSASSSPIMDSNNRTNISVGNKAMQPTQRRGGTPIRQIENAASMVTAKPLRVLVAEDNPINQKVFMRLLSPYHSVTMVKNGREAVHAFLEQPNGIDLILMDVHMPVMDGLTATRVIRYYEQQAIARQLAAPSPASSSSTSFHFVNRNRAVSTASASGTTGNVSMGFGGIGSSSSSEGTSGTTTSSSTPSMITIGNSNSSVSSMMPSTSMSSTTPPNTPPIGITNVARLTMRAGAGGDGDSHECHRDPVASQSPSTKRRAASAPWPWAYTRVPIVAATAGALEEEQRECIQAGMDDVLTKPIDRYQLQRKLARFPPRFQSLVE